MKFPKNKVDIINDDDCIRLSISMIHPKWISNLLFSIAFIIMVSLILLTHFFNLFVLMGPGILFFISLWLFIIYRIGKVACWHRYGLENYIIADSSFSHQRSYGIYTTNVESVIDNGYQIGFLDTLESSLPQAQRIGKLVFLTVDRVTKIESVLFESALDISLEEFKNIQFMFWTIRSSDDRDNYINQIFLN